MPAHWTIGAAVQPLVNAALVEGMVARKVAHFIVVLEVTETDHALLVEVTVCAIFPLEGLDLRDALVGQATSVVEDALGL